MDRRDLRSAAQPKERRFICPNPANTCPSTPALNSCDWPGVNCEAVANFRVPNNPNDAILAVLLV